MFLPDAAELKGGGLKIIFHLTHFFECVFVCLMLNVFVLFFTHLSYLK